MIDFGEVSCCLTPNSHGECWCERHTGMVFNSVMMKCSLYNPKVIECSWASRGVFPSCARGRAQLFMNQVYLLMHNGEVHSPISMIRVRHGAH